MSSRLVVAAVAAVLAMRANADVKAKAEPVPLEEIVIYTAKKIITMDSSMPEATAVAVGNGRVVSVGSLKSMDPWCTGSRTCVTNTTFEDKVITPGFVEPHLHPLVGGVALSLPSLSYRDQENPFGADHVGITTIEGVQAKVAATLANAPPEGILFYGYDPLLMNGHLDKTFFDFLEGNDSEVPLAIWDSSLHHAYTNEAFIRAVNISVSECESLPGCQVANGEVMGTFLGLLASSVLQRYFVPLYLSDTAFVFGAVQRIIALAQANGITTASDVGLGLTAGLQAEFQVYAFLFNQATTPMRCVAVLSPEATIALAGGDLTTAIGLAKSFEDGGQLGVSDKLMIKGVKFFSDDAFLALTMQMCGNPGYITGQAGLWRNEPGQTFVEKVLPWWNAGFKIHVHSNGDCSQDSVLNLLADLQRATPRFDHRFTFEHFGVSTEEHIVRMKALGAQASVNMHYPYLRGELMEAFIGADRARATSKVGSLVRNGVRTALHTDTPIAPPKPLQSAWVAVNRLGASETDVLAPEERVSVEQALRMITIDAAYILGKEDVIGSIRPGKFADFTILECDPLHPSSRTRENLRDIPVWGTVVGGVVFPNPYAEDTPCPVCRSQSRWH